MAESFTVTGAAGPHGLVTIAWTAKDGFGDPTGRTATMVATAQQVCGTVTGPCYSAAAKPALVAWLTAKQALDTIEGWDVGGDALETELVGLAEIPLGAVA